MRIEVLTFLRFVAALVVVFFHFAKKTPLVAASPGFLTAGPEMVSFFFVLSGFVMTVAHGDRPEQPLRQFYAARFARIAPIYFLALAATLPFLRALDQRVLLAHVFFVQAWLPHLALTLNITGWSISVEVFFYALFPFLLVVVRHPRFTPRVLLAAALLSWAITQLVVVYLQNVNLVLRARRTLHELVHYFPVFHLCSFLLGVAGGAWFLAQARQTRPARRRLDSAVAAGALLITYLVIEHREKWWVVANTFFPTSAALLAPLFLGLILALSRAQGPVVRFFSRAPFVALGEASFAFYILQQPAYEAYVRLFMRVRPRGFDMPMDHFFGFVAFLTGVSLASFYLFERPVRRLLVGFGGRGRPEAIAVVRSAG